jgi:hypothetical protein
MEQFLDNKKNDDLNNSDDEEIMCYCNLCWTTRQLLLFLPNNIIFRNPFTLFTIIFLLFILFFIIIFWPIILFIIKN